MAQQEDQKENKVFSSILMATKQNSQVARRDFAHSRKARKLTFVLAGLFVLLVAALGVWGWQRQKQQPADNIKNVSIPIEAIDKNTLPPGFPQDLPLENGADVVINAKGEMPGGFGGESLRVFTSNKSLEENYNLYVNYLVENGWSIARQNNLEKSKSIFATNTRENKAVSINLNFKSETETSVYIEFTYLTNKTPK